MSRRTSFELLLELDNVDNKIDKSFFYHLGAFYNLSVLNVPSSYWHALIEEDIRKTAFVTPNRHFEWMVVPFVLRNVAAKLQHVVETVILPNNWKTYSCMFEEHLHHVEVPLITFRKKTINVTLKKCRFPQASISFVFLLPKIDNVQPISKYLKPKNTKV